MSQLLQQDSCNIINSNKNISKRSIQDYIQFNKNKKNDSTECISFKNIHHNFIDIQAEIDRKIKANNFNNLSQNIKQINSTDHININNNNTPDTNNIFNCIDNENKQNINKIRSRKVLLKRSLKNTLLIPKTVSFYNQIQDKLTAASLKDIDLEQQNYGFKFTMKIQSDKTGLYHTGSFNSIGTENEINNNNSNNNSINNSYNNNDSGNNYSDFFKKYIKLNKIGQGAHSSVYKCQSLQTNQFYALKSIHNISYENWERLLKLFNMMRNLSHPNLIKYHELYFNRQCRTAYIIMQLCEYNDMRMEMNKRNFREQKFTQKQIKFIVKNILNVLKYLHLEGICHRDIKPQNILYDKENCQVKIIDMDICGGKKYKKDKFQLWTNTGSLLYRAPETFGIGYTQKCDIWSVGVILYEMITMRTPFQAEYQKDYIKNVKQREIVSQISLLDINDEFKTILMKCLQKDVNKRQGAESLYNLLTLEVKDDWSVIMSLNVYQCIKQRRFYDQNDRQLIGLGNLLKF